MALRRHPLSLLLRKQLPTGPLDTDEKMATWPKALLILVMGDGNNNDNNVHDLLATIQYVQDVPLATGGVAFYRLSATLGDGGGDNDARCANLFERHLSGMGFSPFVRTVRTVATWARPAYMDASKLAQSTASSSVVEFKSKAGLLAVTLLAGTPSAEVVGKFDRAWLRVSPTTVGVLDSQLARLATLMRSGGRVLLSVVGDHVEHPAAAGESKGGGVGGGRPPAVQAAVQAAVARRGWEAHVVFLATQVVDGALAKLVDYLVVLPGEKLAPFNVACYCCQ